MKHELSAPRQAVVEESELLIDETCIVNRHGLPTQVEEDSMYAHVAHLHG